MKHLILKPLIAISLLLGLMLPAHTQSIQFDKQTYVMEAGETATVRLAFAEAIPHGLEAYALRIRIPDGLLAIEPSGIGIVAALDNDLLAENPADREIGTSFVEVSGFSAPGQPYNGLAFIELTVTVAEGTTTGDYPLSLAIPMPNSFVDAELNVLDGTMELGTALVRVISPGLNPWPPGVEPVTGIFQATFSGKPGVTATLEVSEDLQTWAAVETFAFGESGLYGYPVTVSSDSGMQFFRLREL